MNRKLLTPAIGLIGLALAGSAAAGTLRCNGELFDDSSRETVFKHTVLEQCGEPDERYGNTWVYERGPELRKVVQFDTDGQLERIEDRL